MTVVGDVYEQPQLLSEYLLFHYGTEAQVLPAPFGAEVEGVKGALDFPLRCVERLIDRASLDHSSAKAYDLGCAVGRSTFELARFAAEVAGYDLSKQFIDAANRLLAQGEIATDILVEGAITETVTLRAPSLREGSSVAFDVGDAVTLAENLGAADLVLAANLLCRLPTPGRFLNALPRLIKPGGQLLLVTPFTWLASFTPVDAWPADPLGNPLSGDRWLEARLGGAFEREHSENLPFLIREHQRKFQWTIASGTRWRRRN
jgi:putative 4-mercaptohistidine N1-methyltranferase